MQAVPGVQGKLDHRPMAAWLKTKDLYQEEIPRTNWDWQKITKTMKHGSKEE